MNHSNTTRRKETQRKLLAYTAGTGAALLAAHGADAAIIHDGEDHTFGDTGGPHILTMEGTNHEVILAGHAGAWSGFDMASPGDSFQVSPYSTAYVGQLNSTESVGPGQTLGWNTMSTMASMNFYLVDADNTSRADGLWDESNEKAFFGFSFALEEESGSGLAAGSTVYGWAEVGPLAPAEGKLLGWAYEDSGEPIRVGQTSSIPEPNTLALLALGAAGVAAMRRRRGQR